MGALPTGGFSAAHDGQFSVKQIWLSLCRNLGSAYNVSQFMPDSDKLNTIIGVKQYAIAYAIYQVWAANERLTNQFIPSRLSCYLSRWEKIFGLLPAANATLASRKQAIADKFELWSKPPTFQNIADEITHRVGDIFMNLEVKNSSLNEGSFPGGLSIPGGVTLPDGPWTSPINTINVVVWQPETHDGYTLMSDSEFMDKRYSITNFLLNYLPAYVNSNVYRIYGAVNGCMTVLAGSIVVLGTGTNFLSIFNPGDIFQSVDDDGNPIVYTIATVDSDTQLTLAEAAPSNNTCGKMTRLGFILDQEFNLNNDVFA